MNGVVGASARARATASAASSSRRSVSGRSGRACAARQLHEPGDEAAELVELHAEVGGQAAPLVGVEVDVEGQQLDVGAQGREGRAELVGGVRDELVLRVAGLLQAGQQLVEDARQPRGLVVAVHGDAMAEVVGARDVLDVLRERRDRPHAAGRDDEAEQRRERDAEPGDEDQGAAQVVERRLHLVQRAADLDGVARHERRDQHPHAGAVALHRRVACALAGGDLPGAVGDRQRLAAGREAHDVAVGVDQLRERTRAAEPARSRPAERLPAAEALAAAFQPQALPGRQLAHGARERAVDLVAQAARRRGVGRERGQHHRHGDRDGGGERDARAEAHGSLRV